jgi:lysophospholipase L1-like esterase
MTATTWTATLRSPLVDPYDELQFSEPREFEDQTVRQVLHLAGGGEAFRVRLTNRFGRAPVTIAGAAVAVGHRRIALTFGGSARCVLAAGGEAVADPVDLAVVAGTDLILSLFVAGRSGLATYSSQAAELARVAAGDHVMAAVLPPAERVAARFFVDGVDVLAPSGTAIAVAFGDSWFEGVGTTTGVNHRSVDYLNRRLKHGWVVNQGISGNRLLRDGNGEHGLARFGRDVASVPGAAVVLTHFGINDLVLPGMLGEPPVTAADLVEGFTALAGLAHRAGLRILAGTIGPFGGASPQMATAEALAVRREVNDWIRGADVFDGVFDVARAVENPRAPDCIRPDLDSGDGMHPDDKGAEEIAAAVDLAL